MVIYVQIISFIDVYSNERYNSESICHHEKIRRISLLFNDEILRPAKAGLRMTCVIWTSVVNNDEKK